MHKSRAIGRLTPYSFSLSLARSSFHNILISFSFHLCRAATFSVVDIVPRGVRWLHLNSFSLSIDGNRLSCRNDALDVKKTSHVEFFGKVHWLTTEKLTKLQDECQNLFFKFYICMFLDLKRDCGHILLRTFADASN